MGAGSYLSLLDVTSPVFAKMLNGVLFPVLYLFFSIVEFS